MIAWWWFPVLVTVTSILWLRRPVAPAPLGYGDLAVALRKAFGASVVFAAWAMSLAAHSLAALMP